MNFRYVIETVNQNGLKETLVEDVAKSEILIGRGASCDLRLVGRLVSLEHARLTLDDEFINISDMVSLSGVLVNNRLVKSQKLKVGDSVKIGAFVFKVTREDGVWGFLEERVQGVDEGDSEAFIAKQVKSLRFQTYIPSFKTLSVLISLIVAVVFGVLPFIFSNMWSWNSGPMSNAHKMIENDCAQCHSTSFVRVQDKDCLSCHKMSDHAGVMEEVFNKRPDLNHRCATCHMEHNGNHGVITRESKLCADCHQGLGTILANASSPDIDSFKNHPEFRVSIPEYTKVEGMEGAESEEIISAIRVSLEDGDKLKDSARIKLNHRIHLEPDLAGADGPETLTCMSCHRLSKDLSKIEPINFERDCQSCHSLEFDARLPGKAVPHDKADIVFNYLYAEFAKLSLSPDQQQNTEESSPSRRRRRPGGAEATRGDAPVEFSRASVIEQSRRAEEELFTRTACHLCHEIADKPEGVATSEQSSKFIVLEPNIPDTWMPGAIFNHGAHQSMSCESCHGGAKRSEETTDVLVPGINNCRQCHSQEKKLNTVKSDCVMCHSYHAPLVMKEEEKQAIEKILLKHATY
jgi:hypothetical protein